MLQLQIVGRSSGAGRVVDPELHRLPVKPRSKFEQAIRDGRAFSWTTVTYDPDAHDTIIGLQNSNADKNLHLERLLFVSDTASQIQVFVASGVTMAGTAVTGVNLNRRLSGQAASAIAKADETGNGAQAAAYAGASAALLFRDVVAADAVKEFTLGGLVIPNGIMFGVDLTTAATAANAVLFGWFDE